MKHNMVIWSTELHKALIDVGVCATRTVQVSCSFDHLVSCVCVCVSVTGNVMPAPCLLPNSTLHAPKNFHHKYLHGINSMFAYKWALQLFRIYVYCARNAGRTTIAECISITMDSKYCKFQSQTDWRDGSAPYICTKENDRIIAFGASFILYLG